MKPEKYSLLQPGEGLIVEKKSRFLSVAFPIASAAEADELLTARRKEHYDARHNCFAYVLGEDDKNRRFSDDGEPSQTAGPPILEAIDAASVCNTLVIVTRYFGGTLLGTGGLTRAYRDAAAAALSNAKKILRKSGYTLNLSLDYNTYGRVEYYLRDKKLPVTDQAFEADVSLAVLVPQDMADAVTADITELSAGSATILRGDLLSYGLTDDNKVVRL